MSPTTRSQRSADRVAVVIPTTGRPELSRAVRSAVNQVEGVEVEVVVVMDGADGPNTLPDDVHERAQQIIFTGGARGGGHARNLGVRATDAPWIAFLDDDDEWLPQKLRVQIDALRDAGEPSGVVSSRHVHVDRRGKESKPAPARVKKGGESVEQYLFWRRRPSGGRASLYTSTLLCSRDVANKINWDESLRRHQDWDWLVRASRAGYRIVQVPDVLARIQVGTAGSISASSDWRESLRWATRAFPSPRNRTLADFVAGQTLRYAITGRSMDGVRRCLKVLVANRRIPSVGPTLIALGGILPRRWVEQILARTR